MIDLSELKGCVAKLNLTGMAMAAKLGISKTSYYKKINGKAEFSLVEAQKISEILNLSDAEKTNIFFCNKRS